MGTLFRPISVAQFHVARNKSTRGRQAFHDLRLQERWQVLARRIFERQSVVMQQIARDRSEAAGFYRFLRNKNVIVPELIELHRHIEPSVLAGRHVLVLGDSTSYNLKSHVGRLQDPDSLGVLEDNRSPGFFAHAPLALDAVSGHILGLADVLFWMRRAVATPQRSAEERESYKWILGAANAKANLAAAACLTFILDRDADNFEVFRQLGQPPEVHFILRLHVERALSTPTQQRLSEALAQAPLLGRYTLALPALDHYSTTQGKRIQRRARSAHIQVRALCLPLAAPATTPRAEALPAAHWCIEAREEALDRLPGDNLLCWRLLTTHPVHTFEQAQQIIHFYTQRWVIEQLFRTTKSEGFNLEATELETVQAILCQAVLTFASATKVLQLVYARDQVEGQPLHEVFSPTDQVVLQHLQQAYQGTTPATQNPFPTDQTSWATWIIARLGGWKGNRTQHPPGPSTLQRGLEKFYVFRQAFEMFNPPKP